MEAGAAVAVAASDDAAADGGSTAAGEATRDLVRLLSRMLMESSQCLAGMSGVMGVGFESEAGG